MNSIEKGIAVAIVVAIVACAYFMGKIDAGFDCYETIQNMEQDDG